MWLGKYLTMLTKPELEELRDLLNLTEDEESVFDCLCRGKSITRTSIDCAMSERKVSYKVMQIRFKIRKLRGGVV